MEIHKKIPPWAIPTTQVLSSGHHNVSDRGICVLVVASHFDLKRNADSEVEA